MTKRAVGAGCEVSKLISAADAAELIRDGDHVLIVGAGGGLLEPDAVLAAIGERFQRTGHPRDLTLIHAAGLGDRVTRGLTPLAQPGLVRRVIGGHWGQCPPLARMAESEEIEAYNIPLGIMNLLHREIAGGRPGLITDVGMNTFVDPRIEGGKMNRKAREDLVQMIRIGGRDYLFYKAYRVDVAIVRGWSADEDGYTSLVGEPVWMDTLAAAMAARTCGGRTIVQVKNIVPSTSLPPYQVKVPGILVDAIVHHPGQWQTYEAEENPVYAGLKTAVLSERPAMDLDVRKVIGRRAAMLMHAGSVGNLGVGVPDAVGTVIGEEGCENLVTLTTEHGMVGGVAARGIVFGACLNFRAQMDGPDMINFYHGGGLDFSFLGFAEADQEGNTNVSKYNGIVMGSGGFVDIAQSARTVVFCGTFTASGLEARVEGGRLRIEREGRVTKLVDHVQQITFSGPDAHRRGHAAYVITERAVFELRPEGLTLTEIAPGVDLERDVLGRMGFRPRIAVPLRTMDPAIFSPAPIGLARWWAGRQTAAAGG